MTYLPPLCPCPTADERIVGLVRETVCGIDGFPTRPVTWLPTAGKIVPDIKRKDIDTIIGRRERPRKGMIVKQTAKIDSDGTVFSAEIGNFLLAMFGDYQTPSQYTAPTPVVGSPLMYDHLFKVGSRCIPCYTWIEHTPQGETKTNSSIIESLAFTYKKEEFLQYKSSWMGSAVLANTPALTPAILQSPDSNFFSNCKISIKTAPRGATYALTKTNLDNALADMEIFEMEFDIKNAIKERNSFCNPKHYAGGMEVSGSFSAESCSPAYIQELLANTSQAMRITIQADPTMSLDPSNPDTLEFDFIDVGYESYSYEGSGDDILQKKIVWKAYVDNVQGMIYARLRNGQSITY